MIPLLVVIALLVAAILATVIVIADDVRAIRARLGEAVREIGGKSPFRKRRPRGQGVHKHGVHSHGPTPGHIAIWVWLQGQWGLVVEEFPEGVDPGPPPSWPGAYEGDRVRTYVEPTAP